MSVLRLLLLGALLLLAEGCLSPPRPLFYQQTALPREQIAAHILETVSADLEARPQSREARLLRRFYAANRGLPAWINRHGISLAAWQLLAALADADREGLPPERHDPDRLRKLLRPAADENEPFLGWPPVRVAKVDIALSRAFFRYAGDNLWGQERSWRSRNDWHRSPRDLDPVQLLSSALELDTLPSTLADLPTTSQGYLGLRNALHRYRNLADLGGWPGIDSGPTPHIGESDPRVPQLRRRLWLEGDLSGELSRNDQYDSELRQALKRFQRRHGLAADGTLGPRSLQALNMSVEQRIDQILRNMERWRWEEDSADRTEIKVNLAAFSLEVSDGEESLFSMPVVIGRRERSTPLFTSQLEALVFSPYWYVPPTLLHETLPRIAADPSYLRRNHYEVLDPAGNLLKVGSDFGRSWQRGEVNASLRQQPGPWNPMGNIKFLLPNPWSIYLHDTPLKQLFSRTQRAFSSGCIRLSQPRKLASWLLERSSWDPAKIKEVISSNSSRMIQLERPVDLKIGYWTAWVADSGRLNFREDVYGRDQRLARELRQNQIYLSQSQTE
jgi:murein L,D-transpeptidase YcbB/YkuD